MMEAVAGCTSLVVALEGRVVSGRGLAARELAILRTQVQAIVKEPLFPGSLNIVLNRPVRLLDSAGYAFDGGYRTLWRASLGGVNVWAYRWRESPLHVVEVLSSFHLREHLNLKDGQSVSLKINQAHLGETRFQERLIWAALWIGRRRWFYSSKYYASQTVRVGKDLGATQESSLIRGPLAIMRYVFRRLQSPNAPCAPPSCNKDSLS
jgi:hypothetical protein